MFSIKFGLAYLLVLGGLCVVDASASLDGDVDVETMRSNRYSLTSDSVKRVSFMVDRSMVSLALQQVRAVRAGDPPEKVCTSAIFDYIRSQMMDLSDAALTAYEDLEELGVTDWPWLQKMFEDHDQSDEYLGPDPEDKNQARNFERIDQAKRLFPHKASDRVLLLGVHPGKIFGNLQKLFEILRYQFDVPLFQAVDMAPQIQAKAVLVGLDNPLFSLNAWSVAFVDDPPKILYGDGIDVAMSALGFGAYAREFTIAHEFSHQIQFAHDVVTPNNRSFELMADFLGGYLAHHLGGFGFNSRRMERVLFAVPSKGDCEVDDHGTPDQRAAAVQLAVDMLGYGYSIVGKPTKKKNKQTKELEKLRIKISGLSSEDKTAAAVIREKNKVITNIDPLVDRFTKAYDDILSS